MNRLVIVPNPQLEAAGQTLKVHLATLALEIDANNLVHLMGQLSLRVLPRIAAEAEGTELLLWARDGRDLTIIWNSRVSGDRLEGHARASASEGLVARVLESHRSAADSVPDLQTSEWTNLERIRGPVESMAASPVIVFERCVGVLCRVRYIGSNATEVSPPAEGAAILSKLVEDRLIRLTLGLESS